MCECISVLCVLQLTRFQGLLTFLIPSQILLDGKQRLERSIQQFQLSTDDVDEIEVETVDAKVQQSTHEESKRLQDKHDLVGRTAKGIEYTLFYT